jgi:hypothetical protein
MQRFAATSRATLTMSQTMMHRQMLFGATPVFRFSSPSKHSSPLSLMSNQYLVIGSLDEANEGLQTPFIRLHESSPKVSL